MIKTLLSRLPKSLTMVSGAGQKPSLNKSFVTILTFTVISGSGDSEVPLSGTIIRHSETSDDNTTEDDEISHGDVDICIGEHILLTS